MFPLWDLAIAPVLAAADARRVVEIGALRGDNTRQILDRLGSDSVLHVIDPSPGFDPTEHERRFGGRYVFHRALSVEALPAIGPVDVALIDGDHNWYTVVNELRILRRTAEAAKELLPVLILHDVGWPYGRRDLYYAPDTIPEEHRQPYRKAGMRPGRADLLDRGGMSAGHWNAEREGGPHNGVMTALDDFLAEYGRPVRTVVLPLYFGLAVVVDEKRLTRQPALAAALDRLESPETKDALIQLGETIRLRAIAHNHTLIGERDERIGRLARRYLDRVIQGIVDEPRLETQVDPSNGARSPIGRAGLEALDRAATSARAHGVAGHFVVCGAGSSGSAVLLRAHLEAHDDDTRHIWIADRFPPCDAFERFGLLDEQVQVLQGELTATLPDTPVDQVALLVIGPTTGSDARAALDHLYPRLSPGGTVAVEDLSAPGIREAVEAFRATHGITCGLEPFGSSGTTWTTARSAPAGPRAGHQQ